MYSSDSDYRLRRTKAEQDAHRARQQATLPHDCEEASPLSPCRQASDGGSKGLFSRLREDDLLILALLFLILNESSEDDPLILIILAALLFS